MGVYPIVGLKQARDKRDAARKQLAAGIDPGLARKAERSADADSFEAVAREWFAKYAPRWAPGHASKIIGRFEAADLRGALPPVREKHHAALADSKAIGALLRAIDGYGGGASSPNAPCAWRPSRLCGLASYVKPSGRRSTLRPASGASPPSA